MNTTNNTTSGGISQEDMDEINALSIAFGYPYLRFLVINELRDAVDTLHSDAKVLIDYLVNDAFTTKWPLREFPTEIGPMTLVLSTKNDTQLIAEDMSTPLGTLYPRDHKYYKIQALMNETSVQELFAYLMNYITNIFQHVDPIVYETLCKVYECDRIVGVPEKTKITEFGSQDNYFVVEKLAMSIGFVKNESTELPKFSSYCLSAHLREH